MKLSELSRKRLDGVHPDLVAVVERASEIGPTEILVVEGVRTTARQKKLVADGKSKTMNSRHLTGHAVDLCAVVEGKLLWGKPFCVGIETAMKNAARELNVEVEWGGDWKSFVDTPHWQLSRAAYPAQDTTWQAPDTPAKAEVKAAMAKSSKHRAAGWSKWSLIGAGGITAGWPEVKTQIGVGQEMVATFEQLIASHSLLAVSGLCIAAAIIFNWMQIRQRDDYTDGRYTPSGEAK